MAKAKKSPGKRITLSKGNLQKLQVLDQQAAAAQAALEQHVETILLNHYDVDDIPTLKVQIVPDGIVVAEKDPVPEVPIPKKTTRRR